MHMHAGFCAEPANVCLRCCIVLLAMNPGRDGVVECLNPDFELECARRELLDELPECRRQVIGDHFKMEEQSNYTVVEKAGFSLFNREKMLKILGCYHSGTGEQVNNILLDYMDYLLELDENIKSFQSLPLNKWNWYSWKGFFSTIQKVFVGGEWDYVPNPAGGFLGFWWCWNYNNWNGKEFEYYLQLEQDQLVFKLYAYKPEDRYEIREYYRNKLYPAAKKQGANIQQYGRIGTYMGVAKLSGDYRIPGNDGLIDLSATIDNLRRMEQLITETEKELSIT